MPNAPQFLLKINLTLRFVNSVGLLFPSQSLHKSGPAERNPRKRTPLRDEAGYSHLGSTTQSGENFVMESPNISAVQTLQSAVMLRLISVLYEWHLLRGLLVLDVSEIYTRTQCWTSPATVRFSECHIFITISDLRKKTSIRHLLELASMA